MKKFMTLALATAMTAAMACTAFADAVTLDEIGGYPFVLDGTEKTAPKMYQINIDAFDPGNDAAISKITIVAEIPFEAAGWYGGGGGVGYNNADGDWVQIDFNIDQEAEDVQVSDTVSGSVDGDEVTFVLDFSKAAKSDTTAYGLKDDGTPNFLQIGWWWGAGDTFTVKSINVEYAEAAPSADVAPIAYLAAIVAVAGVAMVASKKRA